jgi:hypothetical protein
MDLGESEEFRVQSQLSTGQKVIHKMHSKLNGL